MRDNQGIVGRVAAYWRKVRRKWQNRAPGKAAKRSLLIEDLEKRTLLSVTTSTWIGGHGNNWSTAANWLAGSAPISYAALIFSGANTTTNNDMSGMSFTSIEFSSPNFTLGSNSITLTSGVTVDSGVSNSSISLAIGLSGSNSFSIGGTGLSDSGVISGTGSLTKTGTGTLTLGNANTYTGGTTISGGVLQAGSASSLGSSGGLAINAGSLEATASFTWSQGITLGNSAATIQVDNGATLSATGVISGSGGLTKTGVGTLNLSGINTYANGTTINSGVLQIGSASGLSASGGGLTINNTGTLEAMVGFTWSRGILLGSSAATIQVDNSATLSATGVISGSGALNKAGTGTLVLSNSNTYTAGTTINGGTLQLGNGSSGGSVSGAIVDNGTLALCPGGSALAVPNTISGTGALSMNGGSGTVTLSGTNTYADGTTVNSGTLKLGNTSALGNTANPLQVNSNGTLNLNGNSITVGLLGGYGTIVMSSSSALTVDTGSGANAVNSAFAGTFSGPSGSALNVNGSGTLTLSGNNSGFSGLTTVQSGTLDLEGALATPWSNSVLTVQSGARVVGSDSPLTASITGPSQQGSVFQFTGTACDKLNGSSNLTLTWQVFDASNELVASQTNTGTSATFNFTPAVSGSTYTVSLVASDSEATSPVAISSDELTFTPASTCTPTVTASSSANPAVVGQPVTFTATVSGNLTGGTVTFFDGANSLGPAENVTNGSATLPPAQQNQNVLFVGSNAITAQYSGNGSDLASTSQPLQVLVLNKTLPNMSYNSGDTVADANVNQATPSPLTDGSLVLPIDAAGLTYISGANGQPIITADCQVVPSDPKNGNSPLTGVTATLSIGGNTVGTSYYGADDVTGTLANGTTGYRFAVPVTATTLQTGQYNWSMTITDYYSDGNNNAEQPPVTGTKDVLNWNLSPYGEDCWVQGLDYLVADGASEILVKSDGTMGFFQSEGSGSYSSPAGPFAFDTLSYNGSNYVFTGTDGTEEIFTSNGQLYQFVDADGNITQYGYSGATLAKITYNNATLSTYAYNTSGLLASVTNNYVSSSGPAGTTWLGYNSSGQLTTVKQPDPANGTEDAGSPVTTFAYTSALLTSVQDADNNFADYAYRPDGTLETASSMLNQTTPLYTDTYRAAQSQFYGSESSGVPGSQSDPAYLVISATARAVAYDQSQNPTAYTFDAYGNVTSIEDPLGNSTLYDRNWLENGLYTGLVKEMDQPVVGNGSGKSVTPVTTYTYDNYGSMNWVSLPDGAGGIDGTQENWTYEYNETDANTDAPIDLVKSSYEETSQATEQTVYSYNSSSGLAYSGDPTYVEQEANGYSSSNSAPSGAPGAYNSGQNTAQGGNPITSYVYTPVPGSSGGTPAGLVASTTNPDGDVTAYLYDSVGNVTAMYQGQTIAMTSDSAAFNNLAPGVARTYDVYGYSTSTLSGSNYTISNSQPGA
ncbi:MAG: beta strand repeat-containing protein, partial [Thermoguttaceae bacterium]